VSFERKIIRNEDCPRCGAIASVRVDESGEDPPLPDVVMLRLVCPKCKLERAAGMTTKAVLRLEKRERALLTALKAKSISQTDLRKIRAKLRDVQLQLERARLGL